jgi:hypothetical protein
MVFVDSKDFKENKMYKKVTEIKFSAERLALLKAIEKVALIGHVIAVLESDKEIKIIHGVNIVTDQGDKYYAQKAMGETPTKDFAGANAGLRLGTGTTPAPGKADNDVITFLSGSGHMKDATYPRTVDPDTDNTGAGVDIATWRYSYLTSEGNGSNINEGAVVDHTTTPTAALTHFFFAALFSKTSSDTLKVFVNTQFNGI